MEIICEILKHLMTFDFQFTNLALIQFNRKSGNNSDWCYRTQ